jgi:hypothetical protein
MKLTIIRIDNGVMFIRAAQVLELLTQISEAEDSKAIAKQIRGEIIEICDQERAY